jgi:hypothetical protein
VASAASKAVSCCVQLLFLSWAEFACTSVVQSAFPLKAYAEPNSVPVILPLSDEAVRFTKLHQRLLRPVHKRDAVLLHPVNGHELVEQAVAQRKFVSSVPIRPFAAEVPRHIFQRQRQAANFEIPVAVGS